MLDAGKGALVVWYVGNELGGIAFVCIAAMGAITGHMFPIWLKGKGGKGVATALAVFAIIAWPLAILACALWLLVFMITRISSLSAIVAMAGAMLAICFSGHMITIMTIWVIALAVMIRHQENINRLLKGKEKAF